MRMRGLVAGLFGIVCIAGLCGFDKNMTVEELENNCMQAVKETKSVTMDIDLSGEISLRGKSAVSGESRLAGGYNGQFVVRMSPKPLRVVADGNARAGALGIDLDSEFHLGIYEFDDGTAVVWADGMAAGEQLSPESRVLSAEELSDLKEQLPLKKKGSPDFEDLWSLKNTPRKINGKDCYQVLGKLNYSDMAPFVKESVTQAQEQEGGGMSESDLEMMDQFLGGLCLNMELDIDDSTFLPAASHTDMKGSNLDALNEMFAQLLEEQIREQGAQVDFNLTVSLDQMSSDVLYTFSGDVLTLPESELPAIEQTEAGDSTD